MSEMYAVGDVAELLLQLYGCLSAVERHLEEPLARDDVRRFDAHGELSHYMAANTAKEHDRLRILVSSLTVNLQ